MQSINVPQGSLKTQYFYDRIFVSSEVEEEQEAGKKRRLAWLLKTIDCHCVRVLCVLLNPVAFE